MKDASDFLSRGLAMTTPHPLGERIVRAEGCWLETESGERLFDLVSGIGVSNLGHGHPAIREALHAQVDKHLHVMVYGEYAQSAQDRAAEVLLSSLEDTALDSVYFVNSGTEAIEGAMKLVRRVTGRTEIFGVWRLPRGHFRGIELVHSLPSPQRLHAAVARCGSPRVWRRCGTGTHHGKHRCRVCGKRCRAMQDPARARTTLRALKARCQAVGAMLVLDEIQCGLAGPGMSMLSKPLGWSRTCSCWARRWAGACPSALLWRPPTT